MDIIVVLRTLLLLLNACIVPTNGQRQGKETTEVSKDTTADPIEGTRYFLKCDVTNWNPGEDDIYQWERDGIIVGGQTGPQLYIHELDRDEHSKTFTCAVDIGAGMGDHGTGLALHVWYAPTNTEGDYILRLTAMRKNVTLPCDVYANPAPTAYAWSKNGINLNGEENAFLNITFVTEADFDNYTCTVTNAVSAKSFVVHLVSYSVPEQPSQFESMPNSSQSILLSWLPQHNGGMTQTFELEGRISTDVDEYVTIMKGIADPNLGSGDRIPVLLVVDNLGNQQLEPVTSYNFRVRGVNSHPLRTGPYAFTSGSTIVRPVFKIYLDSFMYIHETTRVSFAWVLLFGDPSMMELQYRLIPKARHILAEWGVMLADVDRVDGSSTGITNVTLSRYKSYEFQLVAFEGPYETPPPAEMLTPSIHPPAGEKSIVGVVVGTLFGGMMLGSLFTLGFNSCYLNKKVPPQKGDEITHFENEGYMNIVSTGELNS